MLAIVPSATLHGLDGRFIRVEVDVAPGLPGFTIVGLADAALQEARERVRGALRNAGFVHPPRRITVNLAPADLRKAGASLDLAMAIGILLGSEQVRAGPGRLGAHRRAVARRRGPLRAGRPADGRGPGAARAATGRGRGRRGRRGAARRRDRGGRRRDARSMRSRSSGRDERRRVAPPPRRIELVEAARDGRWRAARLPVPRGPPASPVRTCARCAARSRRGAGSRSRWPAVTACCSSGRPARARRCWRGRSRACCRRSTTPRRWRRPSSRRPPARVRSRELRRRPPFRAPHHTISYAGDGRRRAAPVARRDHPRRPGRPVPRRAARVRARRPRGAPPADGGGSGRDLAGRTGDDLPGPVPARRGDEPVPVRLRRARPIGRAAVPPLVPERYQRRVSGPLRDRIDLWIAMPRVAPLALVRGPEPEGSAVVGARIAAAGRSRWHVRAARSTAG